jgi:hypothetical protein
MSGVIDDRCDLYETQEINIVLIKPIQTFMQHRSKRLGHKGAGRYEQPLKLCITLKAALVTTNIKNSFVHCALSHCAILDQAISLKQ